MPFCPKCGNEYRDEFSYCSDCNCELVECLEEEKDNSNIKVESSISMVEEVQNLTTSKKTNSSYSVYQNSAEKAEDNKSSAMTLLLVGFVGMILLALVWLEIIPLYFYGITKYLAFGVMFTMFMFFIISGFYSLKKSKIYFLKAENENSLLGEMKEWCISEIQPLVLDQELFGEDKNDLSEEELYFKRIDAIKLKLSKKYLDVDEALLDEFLDQIYEELF